MDYFDYTQIIQKSRKSKPTIEQKEYSAAELIYLENIHEEKSKENEIVITIVEFCDGIEIKIKRGNFKESYIGIPENEMKILKKKAEDLEIIKQANKIIKEGIKE